MAAGTVKWFTRKSGPSSTAADSNRGPIGTASGSLEYVAPSDQAGPAVSGTVVQQAEFRCAGCGYGIVVSGILPRCPMCQTSDWEPQTTGMSSTE